MCIRDRYDPSSMQIQYDTYMASGRLYPHHADDIEPEGNFDTPTNAPNIFDVINTELAWHYWTINPKGRVDFITLDGKGEFVLLA